MKKIKVGISGFGLSGRYFHFPFLSNSSQFEVRFVHSSRGQNLENEFSGVQFFDDFEKFCSQQFDLMCICVPNHLHFEYASIALRHGKHVLVEKPFTVTSEEASALIEKARKADRVLTVFQNRRFDADFLTIRDLLETGVLGKVVEFQAHFDRFRPEVVLSRWKEKELPGGGILYDLGAHLLDQAFCLFGYPLQILADLDVQRSGASQHDSFYLMLKYDSMIVRLRAGCLVAEAGPRYIIHGTKGSFLKPGIDPQEDQLRSGMNPLREDFGLENESTWGALTLGESGAKKKIPSLKGAYHLFFDQLARSISYGESPPVPPIEALNVIKAIELAHVSSQERRWLDFNRL